MNSPRALGRFFGPYLTFAALSGLGVGFGFGAIVTLVGLLFGVWTLIYGAFQGSIAPSAVGVAQAFPYFALAVLCGAVTGLIGGFLTALVSALVGGRIGYWWSFLFTVTVLLRVSPFNPHGESSFGPLYCLSLGVTAFGALLPIYILAGGVSRYAWHQPVRQYLSDSWLAHPPQSARIAGIVLPVLLYGAWEIHTIWPEFNKHRNYVARIGKWATWQNSRRLAMSQNGYRTSICQSNLQQIALATRQYMSDYNEFLPPTPVSPSGGVGAIMQPYLRSTQVFQCPQELFRPQNADFASGNFSDYWFNARLYAKPEAAFSYIDKTVTWGDGNTGAGEANAAYSLRSVPPNWAPSMRHWGGSANYAFADGHVKRLTPRAISNSTAPNGLGFTMMP